MEFWAKNFQYLYLKYYFTSKKFKYKQTSTESNEISVMCFKMFWKRIIYNSLPSRHLILAEPNSQLRTLKYIFDITVLLYRQCVVVYTHLYNFTSGGTGAHHYWRNVIVVCKFAYNRITVLVNNLCWDWDINQMNVVSLLHDIVINTLISDDR